MVVVKVECKQVLSRIFVWFDNSQLNIVSIEQEQCTMSTKGLDYSKWDHIEVSSAGNGQLKLFT